MASKKIIWSKIAQNDFIDILSYWIERNKSNKYSLKLYNDFKKIEKLISIFPHLGKQTDYKDIRAYIKENFSVYYKESVNSISILHIWDNRRNPVNLNL